MPILMLASIVILRRALAAIGVLAVVAAAAVLMAYLARFEFMRWRDDLPAFTHESGEVVEHRVAMRDAVHLGTWV